MPAVLDIRALTRRCHAGQTGCSASALVLADVWLTVDAGERLAVCGATALSRSTLLLCAAGLLRPDTGTVCRSGTAAYVAPDAPPLGGLTVSEMLEWQRRALLARSAGVQPPSAFAVLQLADCLSLADVRVRLLSSSSARRVAVARALLDRPALLAVDARDDPSRESAREMERTIARVASSGVAVLFAAPSALPLAEGVRAFSLRSVAPAPARVLQRKRSGGRDGTPATSRRAVAEPTPPRAARAAPEGYHVD